MPELPETRQSLLIRVQYRDRDAWAEFSEIYRPVIYRLVRQRGWQDADAQDITQLVMVKISRAIARFEPDGPARFRTWLTTVCRNTLVDQIRQQRKAAATEVSFQEHRDEILVAAEISDQELTTEYRRQVFRWSARQARKEFSDTTWRAFWETTVEGKSPQAMAAETSLSVGAIYTARSRVMQRLKQLVQEYVDADL